jgi:hypothetical protein
MVDWDTFSRAQRIEVVDVATGAVLDSRSVSTFHDGTYLVWEVSGNVRFRVVQTGSLNAVISGVFFGSAPPPQPGATSARFLQTDVATRGNWKGVYGADGYNIAADAQSYPSWATVTLSNWDAHTWTLSTSETRALQRGTAAGRIASAWYRSTSASIDVRITDGATHRIALYMLDWDSYSRAQRIEVVDIASGAVLDSRNVTDFHEGTYLVWEISGNVRFRVSQTGSYNAVVNGLFFR